MLIRNVYGNPNTYVIAEADNKDDVIQDIELKIDFTAEACGGRFLSERR